MRKLLLFLPVVGMCLSSQAQDALRDNKLDKYLQDKPVVMQSNHQTSVHHSQHKAGRGGGLTAILNSQPIGTSGNLLTIIEGNCNQLDVNDSLNVVTFIHRNDPNMFPGTNVAQYRYDISKDGGNTWTNDIGPITDDPSIDNVSVNGRFPQAVVYNQAGNSVADSAFLVYSGTWHDNVTWAGQMRGEGKLSGDLSTFSVTMDVVNNKHVGIATGMCKGAPGVFWNVNTDYSGTFNAGPYLTTGVIVEKGVFNTSTNKVDWTYTEIPQTFVTQDNGTSVGSVATAFDIAFDPSGQYGWISCVGDITPDNDSVYDPIFWKTVDGGANWTGPIMVDLDDVAGVKAHLNPTLVDGVTPTSLSPTTAFDANLEVDTFGNPHLLTVVGNGTEYSIQTAGYTVWDITFDTSNVAGCSWKGIYMDDILSLRGTMTSDNPAQTVDNRPLISRTPDGTKLFFFWLSSDADFLQSTDNDAPNLFGKAIDVTGKKITPLYNFTEGDSLWGGETVNTPGGLFAGAIFPTVSPTARVKANAYNIPTVFTQIDYQNGPGSLGSSEQPAAFFYVNNLDIAKSAFTDQLDNVPPVVTLNGADTVAVLTGGTYTEDSATAFDCVSGILPVTIVNAPDPNVPGVYNVLYIATDGAGNSDTAVRYVLVGTVPNAEFTWSFPSLPYQAKFVDQSTGTPTSWYWTFGDGGANVLQNPSRTYAANGTYNVCLKATNAFGTSTTTCHDVVITGVGIDEPEYSQHISMFPNPSTGKVFITIDAEATYNMTVTVYNLLGEVAMSPVNYKAGTTSIQINMSNVANGLYFVKIQSDKGTAVKPLTLNHQ